MIAIVLLVMNFATARAEPHAVYEIDLVDPISGVWQRDLQEATVKGGFGVDVSFFNRQPMGAPVQNRYGVTVRTQSAEAHFNVPTFHLNKYQITSIQYAYGRRLWHRSWFDINAGLLVDSVGFLARTLPVEMDGITKRSTASYAKHL